MADFSTFDGFRDYLIGMLAAAVLGLLALVRKLDVGEISRRLDRLEDAVDRMRTKHEHKEGEK